MRPSPLLFLAGVLCTTISWTATRSILSGRPATANTGESRHGPERAEPSPLETDARHGSPLPKPQFVVNALPNLAEKPLELPPLSDLDKVILNEPGVGPHRRILIEFRKAAGYMIGQATKKCRFAPMRAPKIRAEFQISVIGANGTATFSDLVVTDGEPIPPHIYDCLRSHLTKPGEFASRRAKHFVDFSGTAAVRFPLEKCST
jgi:hypothetical protein